MCCIHHCHSFFRLLFLTSCCRLCALYEFVCVFVGGRGKRWLSGRDLEESEALFNWLLYGLVNSYVYGNRIHAMRWLKTPLTLLPKEVLPTLQGRISGRTQTLSDTKLIFDRHMFISIGHRVRHLFCIHSKKLRVSVTKYFLTGTTFPGLHYRERIQEGWAL